ncbi:acyltransferase [Vibrio sp. 10N.286.49.C2]|nr:acyltransferase [Vibrio sp. 10N.286.49.C2]PMH57175.1 acyltransferase [Vibrio sp. 10N.286.49.B1]
MAVVLFHFNEQWMPGGFIGVDVFFVISGFLMTGIIFRGLEKNNFSILNFYIARANRIIPALVMLCLVLLVFGWFYLTPTDYTELGKHISSSIGFMSNIIYWKESSYFAVSSYEKWLLHTWSLSVECQFYIIYPLVLVAMSKICSLKTMKSIVLIGAIIGFIFSILATYRWPTPAYYLLPTRAWELMFGGVAYLYPLKLKKNKKKLVEILGLALIATSFIFISKEELWPGYLSIIPVFGAFLLIQSNQNDSVLTNNSVFQAIGKWSYSIYLWHWPFVVAINYFSLNDSYIYIFIVISIVMGFFSNRYLEVLIFKSDNIIVKYYSYYIAFLMGIAGVTVLLKDGFKWHYHQSIQVVSSESYNKNPRRDECHIASGPIPECVYGDGELGAIVIGDSHAQSIIRSVEKSLGNKSVLDWTKPGCRTVKNILNISSHGLEDRSCGNFISYALDEIKKYPNIPLIISNRYMEMLLGRNEYGLENRSLKPVEFIPELKDSVKRDFHYIETMNNAFIDTLCSFSKQNPVFLLQPTPEMKDNVPQKMAKELMKGNEIIIKLSLNEYEDRNKFFNSMIKKLGKKCNVTLINVKEHFCDTKYCYGDFKGRPLYFDDNHLSEYGASRLIPTFEKFLDNM